MFVSRENELNYLNKIYKSDKAEFIVIYGKRRVGKTELIKHFVKNKNAIYFLAQQITEQENMKILSEIMADYFNDNVLSVNSIKDINQLNIYLKSKIGKDKLIFVIDEFPYLVEGNKGVPSSFQSGWDEILSKLPIVLILCGSSVSMMERYVLSEKSPLFGRRTGQILLKPFTFYQSRALFINSDYKKQIAFYSALGGMPAYLDKFAESDSLKKNIENNILKTSAYLYNEVEFMLNAELREPKVYLSILKAIAYGRHKTSEILNETGIEKNVLHKYLSVLEALFIIEKNVPVTINNPVKSRDARYNIVDNFIKFYFRFVLPNKSMIEAGRLESVLFKIMRDIKHLESSAFENACREWLLKNWQYFDIANIGKWWHGDTEIDIIMYDQSKSNAMFAECKWTRRKTGENILDDLIQKSGNVEKLTQSKNVYYILFSRSGFTASLQNRANETPNIFLYDMNDLS